MPFFATGTSLTIPALIFLAVLIVLFLIVRELVCWYLKINKMFSLLEKIDARLSRLPVAPAPSAPEVARPAPAPGSAAAPTVETQPTASPLPSASNQTTAPAQPTAPSHQSASNQPTAPQSASVSSDATEAADGLQRIIDGYLRECGVDTLDESWNVERLLREAENPARPESVRENINRVIAELMGRFRIYRENSFWGYGETLHKTFQEAIDYVRQISK